MLKHAPEDLLFLDESGTYLDLCRHYGRAPGAQRIYGSKPFNKGCKITMIGVIGLKEVTTALYGEWSVNGALFVDFLATCLAPHLRPGQVVIMDNLSAHKVAGVREVIEATGAKLVYLPPYSPDLSPIELMWSKVKSWLRKKAVQTRECFQAAITEAFKAIQPHELTAWFRHCGYKRQNL